MPSPQPSQQTERSTAHAGQEAEDEVRATGDGVKVSDDEEVLSPGADQEERTAAKIEVIV